MALPQHDDRINGTLSAKFVSGCKVKDKRSLWGQTAVSGAQPANKCFISGWSEALNLKGVKWEHQTGNPKNVVETS